MCSKEDFEIFCQNKKLELERLSIFSKGEKIQATLKVAGKEHVVTKEAVAETAEEALAKARLLVCLEIEMLSTPAKQNTLNDLEKYCHEHGYTYKINYSSSETEKSGVEGQIQIFKRDEEPPKVTLPFLASSYRTVHSSATEKALLYFQTL